MSACLRWFTALLGCISLALAGPERTEDGFALPQPGATFTFPRDHGSHPEFKVEWWYLTGHLDTADGQRFGYQVTFFRRGLRPGGLAREDQIYLAHVALSDPRGGKFYHQERIARPGWDADASTSTLAVRNGPWSLRWEDTPQGPRLVVTGSVRAEVELRLRLEPVKPLVFFGDNGVSRKGDDPTAASHYLTFTRLATTGDISLQGKTLAVTGETWMDHEISSSQLDRDQVGWDWFGLQLRDGREIMLYRLRRADGSSHPASRLTWVDREGRTQTAPFTWTVLSEWTSPVTQARYPTRFAIGTVDPATGKPVTLTFTPVLDDQELIGRVAGISYWEGACDVIDATADLQGRAYVELTGYAKPLSF